MGTAPVVPETTKNPDVNLALPTGITFIWCLTDYYLNFQISLGATFVHSAVTRASSGLLVWRATLNRTRRSSQVGC